ncbi:hypothetical protein NC653_027340 [Populus alba x Populus x berolinensis]|uniref:Uncharacterized protein n=1 Tax=Populus alba x Populus x berolinensis TaxID=444605 RepID=A0AAD6M5G1_9ROSI|nr:hypothetical protein NC653_027340 [Populus alba x Populus x berolinensis]
MTTVSLKLSVKHDRKHDNPQMARSVAIKYRPTELHHSSNLHDLAAMDSGYTVLHFSFRLTIQKLSSYAHRQAGGESGSPIFHEVLVDGCVPDEATQGAVVGGFGLGIEESESVEHLVVNLEEDLTTRC